MTIAKQAAESWNQRYASSDYIFGTEPNHFLVEAKPFLSSGMTALTVADGEGRNSVWLAQEGLGVTAFDISPVAIDKAIKLAETKSVMPNFHISDCESWNWQAEAFDVVVAIFVQFADPVAREVLFSNIVRTLKPGGILILQGYTPKQLEYKTGGPPCADNLYTEEMLRELFADLNILRLDVYNQVLKEGTQHAGISALIGLIAKKTHLSMRIKNQF